jgi:hypothetical protein
MPSNDKRTVTIINQMDNSGIPFKIIVNALVNSAGGKNISQEVFDQVTSAAYPSLKPQQVNYLMSQASENDVMSMKKLQSLSDKHSDSRAKLTVEANLTYVANSIVLWYRKNGSKGESTAPDKAITAGLKKILQSQMNSIDQTMSK